MNLGLYPVDINQGSRTETIKYFPTRITCLTASPVSIVRRTGRCGATLSVCRSLADNVRCTGRNRHNGLPAAVSARYGRNRPGRHGGLRGSFHPSGSSVHSLRSHICSNEEARPEYLSHTGTAYNICSRCRELSDI